MKILVITGLTVSGNSTIAQKLSDRFQLPILEKNTTYEDLFDAIDGYCSKNNSFILMHDFNTDTAERFVSILKKYACMCITLFLCKDAVSANAFECPGYRINVDATDIEGIDYHALIEKMDLMLNCKSNIPPFKMHENIYFVGARRVSIHIIKTEEGLVMIDTGYPNTEDEIIDSMKWMGLDPKDIIAIFHSHGHFDHYGCTIYFKELSGAKTYISRVDNEIVNGNHKEFSYEHEPIPNFDCDVLVDDDDEFIFGTTKIRCRMTPGHSPGVMSFFIETGTGENRILAAMHGGVGMNALKSDSLTALNLSTDEWRNKFRNSLYKVSDEKVDLVLGNHPGQNKTNVKLQKLLDGVSIIDKQEWQLFLKSVEQKLDRLIEEERINLVKSNE